MQWATQQLVSIFMIVPWKICIFHVTMYWKPLSLVCWTGVLSWVKLNKKMRDKSLGRFGFMLIKSSPSYNTLTWYPPAMGASLICALRGLVLWGWTRMLVWQKKRFASPYGCVSSCPTKNLLQSAQSAGRRPLYFFLSPSSTHLASGDLLSQPSRVIRFPNDRKATRQESEQIDLIWFAHCHCTRSSYQTPCKQNMFLRFHIWRVINWNYFTSSDPHHDISKQPR